jgi:hypothetical protein
MQSLYGARRDAACFGSLGHFWGHRATTRGKPSKVDSDHEATISMARQSSRTKAVARSIHSRDANFVGLFKVATGASTRTLFGIASVKLGGVAS